MKQSHYMKCKVIPVSRPAHQSYEVALELLVQHYLDEGWTLRACINWFGDQLPRLIFVRKERRS